MKKSLILLAFAVIAPSVLADNTMPPSAATQPAAAPVQAFDAKKMTDADLDSVTAGVFILNPGKHSVFIVHKNGSMTCINFPSCAPPPPPPPGS